MELAYSKCDELGSKENRKLMLCDNTVVHRINPRWLNFVWNHAI